MVVDYGPVFYLQTFALFWIFTSLFLAVIGYDRARRYGLGRARWWGVSLVAAGVVGFLVLMYVCRRYGTPPTADDGHSGPREGGTTPPTRSDGDPLVRRKMEMFYVSLFLVPLVSLLYGDEEGLVNFYMLSVVYFVMVYSIREEFESLPLVPRQWEVMLGGGVISLAFLLTPLKWMVDPTTRPFGMMNFAVLLVGLTLLTFGISNFRIHPLKALALGGGLGSIYVALLGFSFTSTVLAVLVLGVLLTAYGLQGIRRIFMPAVVLVTLVFINTGFYENQELIDLATQYLAEFVSKFATWATSLLGYNNYAMFAGDRWDIYFVGASSIDRVGVVGNCTGVVGALFYGVISSALLVWVRCEWWRKVIVIAGGVMGSFITNLFRVVSLILVYWNFDYPGPAPSRMENLLYVHQYLGDILYIVFITVYWVFVLRYIVPSEEAGGPPPPTRADMLVYAPGGRRRDAVRIWASARPGQMRRGMRRMRRRRKYRRSRTSDGRDARYPSMSSSSPRAR